VERGRVVRKKIIVKMSLLVERMVSELNRILNGEKQRQIAPASHILTLTFGGGSWRKMVIFRFPSVLRKVL
jgi:hypothetical protein